MKPLVSTCLTLFYYAYRWILLLEGSAKLEKLSTIDNLSGEPANLISEAYLKAESEWLKRKLRKFPFWSFGHIRLGEVSLDLKDLSSAYASANAAILLGSEHRGKKLLGTCYLRAREGAKAVRVLTEVCDRWPLQISVLEDLGAALMLEGDFIKAKEILEQIPETKRSTSVNAALIRVRK